MLTITGLIIFGMYLPTLYRLSQMKWWVDEYSHAPLVILISLWLIWREREILKKEPESKFNLGGLFVLLFGLLMYDLGIRQNAVVLESASIPFVIMGTYYFLLGKSSYKWLFPAGYLLFIVPPPLFLVDMVTFPLKKMVSLLSEKVLVMLDYPVLRRGILLVVGDYNLLVADACSGMRSIISLLVLICLYVYMQKAPISRKMIVLFSIFPIAIAANTIRITALALITYHLGEAAGSSYYHDLSGFIVFIIALASVMAVDKISCVLLERKTACNI